MALAQTTTLEVENHPRWEQEETRATRDDSWRSAVNVESESFHIFLCDFTNDIEGKGPI